MDPAQLAGGNVPPQALAALQQQAGGMDITSILAQLAQMSPDEVSQALAQLGVNVPPEQLQKAAESWVEQAGDKQASGGAGAVAADDDDTSESAPTASAPTADDETAETTPDDEQAEGETAVAAMPPARGIDKNESMRRSVRDSPQPKQPTAPDMDLTPGGREDRMPPMSPNRLAALRSGGGSARGAGGGGNMDALISAALSQGDPGSMPPALRPPPGAGGPQMRGPAMPGRGAAQPATGQDPRMRAMLQSIYRGAGADARRGVPTGPRTGKA